MTNNPAAESCRLFPFSDGGIHACAASKTRCGTNHRAGRSQQNPALRVYHAGESQLRFLLRHSIRALTACRLFASQPHKLQNCVAPYHDTNNANRGGPHGWNNSSGSVNNGAMDGFLAQSFAAGIPADCKSPWANCTPGTDPRDVMGWHDYHELPNYWSYANLYVLQDRMFESVASYSLPAHLYMLAGQSGGYVGNAAQGQLTCCTPEPATVVQLS